MNDSQKLINEASKAYLEAIFQLLAIDPNRKSNDLNYFKIPLKFDNGGIYLLSLLHVEGAKIQFEKDIDGSLGNGGSSI